MYDFTCPDFHKFANINSEMKKIFTFIFAYIICVFSTYAAVRDEKTLVRGKNNQIITNEKTTRTTTNRPTTKNASSSQSVSGRVTKTTILMPTKKSGQSVATRTPANLSVSRSATRSSITSVKKQNVSARATSNTSNIQASETRTGAEYDQCKTAFFTCMDQFCELKNDNFKRCSCNDRVFGFQDIIDTYQSAGEMLTEFSENLDTVGITRAQATAMKTASEGEDALTEDKSASKQLLQAIMNAISGKNASVGGKYKDLNSISITTDISNAFGLDDAGQIIASYNGAELYKAVYPKCKTAVAQDCNKASLQRAINAYLMAIEQDCNTVETALQSQQKTLKNATHESSAMLDLARVENRRNRNSDDIATCITNVEAIVKSEEVCGSDYHKCLDYGQFIDVTTGAPLTGVIDFYKLGELLTFKNAENLNNQKLSSISNNRQFVKFFENKTKTFAQDALDKCSEQSETVWKQYLDMALLDIYYAQQSKVDEIQQSCFDLVTACYTNQNTAIASAMAVLTGDTSILLKPAVIELTSQMCSDYIESCNNMFAGNVVKMYLDNKDSTDSDSACRAIAQQCFDKFGGNGYENFYYLQSGIFAPGAAIDWFSLYDDNNNIVSPCAQELYATEGCNNSGILERVFGGFNKLTNADGKIIYTYPDNTSPDRKIRSKGVATEVYSKILDTLGNYCAGLNGYLVEYQHLEQYGYNMDNFCQIDTTSPSSLFVKTPDFSSVRTLDYWYHFIDNENMCPANYAAKIDIKSWGVCSCWENGGYRSKNGTTQTCLPIIPIANTGDTSTGDPICTETLLSATVSSNPDNNQWCQQPVASSYGQLCPSMSVVVDENSSIVQCAYPTTEEIIEIVSGYVPRHKAPTTE